MKKLAAIFFVSCVAAGLYLNFGDAQQKWCYIFQSYYWPKSPNSRLEPPAGYCGLWKFWSKKGELYEIALYSNGKMEVQDWFIDDRPWMRVEFKGRSAPCGYEYRFSHSGEVTFVCLYLPEKDHPIIVYDPQRSVDLRASHANALKRYVPLRIE